MRLCLVGKFPPIQGGVSVRMYRLAHGLARRGHAVHVVTNALEVEDAYRVTMRPEDHARLGARYGDGYVRVHHTASDPRGQWHIPWHNPFATKLAGLAIDVIRDHALECVFSWYLEPYGVAGHLAASLTGLPHVMKTAGSDAGRLWQQPGMRSLYDQLFLAADVITAGGSLPKALAELGVRPERVVPSDAPFVPLDEFTPEGEALALEEFGGRAEEGVATLGIFGKLGRFKGMLALLRALRACLDRGVRVRLAAMSQGRPEDERAFAEQLDALGLHDHVIRVPFLPHWRVPAFLRACDVVCSLEQDFPIKGHTPIIAQEVLASGRPALLSHEIAAKQPDAHRLAHGYSCWIIRDSTDPEELTRAIVHVVADPAARQVGARGRSFAEHVQTQTRFPLSYEAAMRLAIDGVEPGDEASPRSDVRGRHGLLELLGMARRAIAREAEARGLVLPDAATPGIEWFRGAAEALASGRSEAPPTAAELGVGLALQLYETQRPDPTVSGEGLYRLATATPSWPAETLAEHRPSLAPGVTARRYPQSPMDVLMGAASEPAGPEVVVVVLPFSPARPVKLYALTGPAAKLVLASDGARTLAELDEHVYGHGHGGPVRQSTLELAEMLFSLGVLSLAGPTPAGSA